MNLHIESPYADTDVRWWKGNLHAHTSRSDGALSPQQVVDTYASLGYNFLMLSDHDQLTSSADLETLDARGMVLIPGNEITQMGPHLLHVNAQTHISPSRDRQAIFDRIRAEGGFAILNHPNWLEEFDHCPKERLAEWQGYTGIEIYNTVCRRAEGSAMATMKWDWLLSRGRRLWGYANDDSHELIDYGGAWNMVQSVHGDRASIIEALEKGRFYASTGVIIERINVEDRSITVATANADRIVVYGNAGKRWATVDEPEFTFHVPDQPDFSYLRFQCWGRGEMMAWTQPFFFQTD